MKKSIFVIVLVAFLFGTILTACGKQEEDPEPGAIETFTEETADQITSSIKKPLNKARSVKKIGQNRMKNLDDMAKE